MSEQKKGRMGRVYESPGKKSLPEKVKQGGRDTKEKTAPTTPRMGG